MNRPIDYSSENGKQLVLAVVVVATFIAALLAGLWFLSAILYICFAADKAAEVIIVNNTGRNLVVTSGERKLLLPSGKSIGPYAGVEWTFAIQPPQEHAWHYELAPIKQKNFYLQIEPGGAIYLLPSPPQQPIQNLPPQPNGYPLRPK